MHKSFLFHDKTGGLLSSCCIQHEAAAMGKEFRIKDRLEVIVEACSRTGEQGANMILAPAVNLHRVVVPSRFQISR